MKRLKPIPSKRPILVVEPTHIGAGDEARYSVFGYRGDDLQNRRDDLTEGDVMDALRTFTRTARKDLEAAAQNCKVLVAGQEARA